MVPGNPGGDWLWGLILFLAVLCAYQPVCHAGFIWDDADHLTQNPCIVGPLGLREIWTTSSGQFYPLVLTLFWAEHALWGLQPLPYHLANLVLHAGSAILLWRVLLGLRVPGAWLGAALWALHPVQVETVAWISETTNTLSGVFYLLTLLFFVRGLKSEERNGPGANIGNDALIWLCAALAMAAKSSTVILPLVLALAAWWKEGRLSWRQAARIAPVLVLSLVTGAVTLWMQHLQEAGAVGALAMRSWPERVATAGCALWFYLGKLLWPHPLIAIYPRWTIDPAYALAYLPLGAWVVVLFFLWRQKGSFSRGLFLAAAYFTAVLLPVLGFADQSYFRFSFVADHFQYLADMGPLALAGAGLTAFFSLFAVKTRWLPPVLAVGVLCLLGSLTWLRTWAFGSPETLWTDTLAKNPRCATAYDNLGWTFAGEGRIDEAISLYHQALAIDPRSFGARYNLGNALLQSGQVTEAIVQYRQALDLRPNDAPAHSNLGVALLQTGDVEQAVAQYKEALRLKPGDPGALHNLAEAQVLLKKRSGE